MGGDIVPGSVLIKNVNIGRDPHDSRYQILRNVDTGLEFKCRRNFRELKRDENNFYEFKNILSKIFKLEGYFPYLVGTDANEGYLLAPDLWEHICPGMAVPCLKAKKSIPRNSGNPIYFSHSKIFHKKRNKNNQLGRSHNYAMAVHSMEEVDPYDGCFQALVFQIGKKLDGWGNPSDIRYIDAYFLGKYGEELSMENYEKIKDFNENHREDLWWHNADKIPQSYFEEISKDLSGQTKG